MGLITESITFALRAAIKLPDQGAGVDRIDLNGEAVCRNAPFQGAISPLGAT